jgi:hypothetical protein
METKKVRIHEYSHLISLFFFSVLFCFQSPTNTLEEDTTTVTQLFHIMSTLKGKLEQENEEKYIGKTTEAYVMNEN